MECDDDVEEERPDRCRFREFARGIATGDEAAMGDVAVKEREEWKRWVAKEGGDSGRRTWKGEERKGWAIMEDQKGGGSAL
jgi:hypothetical protein